MTRIPQHIAIIMDGNGRWATERGKDRSYGHQAGVDTVRRITSECVRLGVKYLTLYTFSTENWNRPATEIHALMGLVLTSLEDEIFMKNNVQEQQGHDDGRGTELFCTLGNHAGCERHHRGAHKFIASRSAACRKYRYHRRPHQPAHADELHA